MFSTFFELNSRIYKHLDVFCKEKMAKMVRLFQKIVKNKALWFAFAINVDFLSYLCTDLKDKENSQSETRVAQKEDDYEKRNESNYGVALSH